MNPHERLDHNPLLEVAKRYKELNLSHTFTFHEKNPDAKNQIHLLEHLNTYIKKYLKKEEADKAQIGALLALKAQLTDPNPRGQVFSFLVDKLQINQEIETILQQSHLRLKMDPTDPRYLKYSKQALETVQVIIERDSIDNVPKNFLKDVSETLLAEKDYIDRLILSLEGKKVKPFLS